MPSGLSVSVRSCVYNAAALVKHSQAVANAWVANACQRLSLSLAD
ncbi:MAG: hypothetical protein HCTETUND2_026 [Candidatus Hodgkinia cicadicola]|nr:MAG: hypothetical protein HCTETUND2_026 [Candidatus Hodgkinia cicadicola]